MAHVICKSVTILILALSCAACNPKYWESQKATAAASPTPTPAAKPGRYAGRLDTPIEPASAPDRPEPELTVTPSASQEVYKDR